MNLSKTLDVAQNYVSELIIGQQSPGYIFHNAKFREEFITACRKLGQKAKLPEASMNLLLFAACFKDISEGILEKPLAEGSTELAIKFIADYQPDFVCAEELKILLGDDISQDPKLEPLGQILHDAKWAFAGKKKFLKKVELMLMEAKKMSQIPIVDRIWYKEFINTLLKNTYLTPWAYELYGERRNKNVLKLKKLAKNLKNKYTRFRAGKDFGRGIDTAFRVSLKNHTDLSRIADGKANMIISINTLILSVLITGLTAGISMDSFSLKLDLINYTPIIILLLSSLLATSFAVFSAVPNINSGAEFSLNDMSKKNMLFFGNFLNIKQDHFVKYFRELKTDQEKLYDNLSRDLYSLGMVLQKKYRLLGIAYRVFIGGLAASLLSFLIIQILL